MRKQHNLNGEIQIVITGIGVVSPLGSGKENFWANLAQGVNGIRPVTSYDLSDCPLQVGGEVADFHPEKWLGNKGMRYVHRGTKMLSSALFLVLQDAGLQPCPDVSKELGMVIGTAFGNFIQTTEYTQRILSANGAGLLPMDGYDAALNSAVNYATVHFKLKSCVRTLSSGQSSGLDSIVCASRLIRLGKARRVIAGGFEQLSPDNYHIYTRRNETARSCSAPAPAVSMPFDRRRSGFVPGEGCWLFLLEDFETAKQRGATIYAEIAGWGSFFAGAQDQCCNQRKEKVQKSMTAALANAATRKEEVQLIVAAAQSGTQYDWIEGRAIQETFQNRVPVTCPKSMTGECFGASGSMELATALLALNQGIVAPTIHYQERDPAVGLNSIVTRPRQADIQTALIHALDLSVNTSSLLIRKHRP